MKHFEFNRSNKPSHLDRHYRSVALHTSLAHIDHQLVSPGERKITVALLFRFSTAKELLFLERNTEPNIDWNNEDHVSVPDTNVECVTVQSR